MSPDSAIDTANPATLAAIVTHENGRNVYAMSDINSAVAAA
ncbi:MAG: hypothetical protein PHX38_02770 [Sulfuricella sp.]|nr:hypothetical protein [Sulfuricella sp.]